MIRPPSLVRPWETYYPRDSAFKQPPAFPADSATQDERDEFKVTVEQYIATLRSCRDTGDWSALRVEGQEPTKFVMGQIDRNIWRQIIDRGTLPLDSKRRIGDAALRALLFRLSCKQIVGWEPFEHEPDPEWDGWVMAPPSLVNKLDSIDQRIVGEIGNEVFERLKANRPF